MTKEAQKLFLEEKKKEEEEEDEEKEEEEFVFYDTIEGPRAPG